MKGSFLSQVRQQASARRRFAAVLVLACGTSAMACPAIKGKMVNGALPSLLPHLIPICGDELWPFSETLRKWKIAEDLQARWVEVYKIPTSQSSQTMANLTKVLTSAKYGYQWRGEFEGYVVSKSTAYKSAVTGKGLWITTLNMGTSLPFTAVAIIGTDRIIDSPKVNTAAASIALSLATVVPTPPSGVGGNPGAARYYRPATPSPARSTPGTSVMVAEQSKLDNAFFQRFTTALTLRYKSKPGEQLIRTFKGCDYSGVPPTNVCIFGTTVNSTSMAGQVSTDVMLFSRRAAELVTLYGSLLGANAASEDFTDVQLCSVQLPLQPLQTQYSVVFKDRRWTLMAQSGNRSTNLNGQLRCV